jgi:hypothetical protein
MFINKLKTELTENTLSMTENGALGFESTGKALVDMNFRISSYRNMSEDQIFNDFIMAFNEDKMLAMRWLFYVRDVRGGLGERRLFRVIMERLANENPTMIGKVLPFVAEFGRWDDLFTLMGTSLSKEVIEIVSKQLKEDIKNAFEEKPISLLAKWMPSINGSSKEGNALAAKLAKAFGVSPRIYRKTLSGLRAHLEIVEQKMSAREWAEIDFSRVPSRANLIYNPAFLKHDEERRRAFLTKVEKGEETIHGGANFPHDILHKYAEFHSPDQALELLWKALPQYGNDMESTIVVADGSGSMGSRVGNTTITAHEVADALAIYFAERCMGEFKNHYITFSATPKLINFGSGSLFSKRDIVERNDQCQNTNIEAVFDLILQTAIKNHMKQEELPATILLISDMEFDMQTGGYGYGYARKAVDLTLFGAIAKRYAEHGYKLPKLAFWNVMSRTGTIPVIQNEMGVNLVSGFSPAAINMVLSGKLDPYDALVSVLMTPRYDVIAEAIK